MQYLNEMFGEDANSNNVKKNRDRFYCPFLGDKCNKKSRIMEHPMGVCSVNYYNKKAIVCPNRIFTESTARDIALDAFGAIEDVMMFPGIKFNTVLNFNYILIKHKELSLEIDDFCFVDILTDSVSGTHDLVRAVDSYMKNDYKKYGYTFGLNTYHTLKMAIINMLLKGQVMEKWGKKIYWVMQSYVFKDMVNRFRLSHIDNIAENSTKFMIYDLLESDNSYYLGNMETMSISVKNLADSFINQPTPKMEYLYKLLEKKIEPKCGIKIR